MTPHPHTRDAPPRPPATRRRLCAAGRLVIALALLYGMPLSAQSAMPPAAPQPVATQPAATPPAATQPVRLDLHGDPLPEHALMRLGTLRLRQTMPIASASAPAHGRILATSGQDGVIRVWDLETGKIVTTYTLDGPHQPCFVNYTPDGKLLTVTTGQRLTMLDAVTGRQLWVADGIGYLQARVTFSADGKLLAASVGGTPVVFDTVSGKRVREMARGGKLVTDVAISPDGKLVAAGSQNPPGVRLWDAATGNEAATLSSVRTLSVAFAPDGQSVLAVEPEAAGVAQYNLKTKEKRQTFSATQYWVAGLSFSPDGKTLVCSGREIRFWDLASGKEVGRLPASGINTPAFLPDGKTVAVAWGNVVRFWDIASGKESSRFDGHTSAVLRLEFSPDGRYLGSTASDQRLRVWDLTTGRTAVSVPRSFSPAMAFWPDARTLAWFSAGNTVQLLDLPAATDPTLAADDPKRVRRELQADRALSALVPGGRRHLAGVATDGVVYVWDLDSADSKAVPRGAPAGIPNAGATALSPDFRRVALLARDNTGKAQVIVRDVGAGNVVAQISSSAGSVSPVMFTADGRLLVTIVGRSICLWEVLTGKPAATFTADGSSTVTHATASPDGRLLAWATADKTAWLYDAARQRTLMELPGHDAVINAMRLHLDAPTPLLATGSADTTILLWDIKAVVEASHPVPAPLSAQRIQELWADLCGDDAAMALQAQWTLSTGGEPVVTALSARLRPAGEDTEQAQLIQKLVANLDHDDFAAREQATTQLGQIGAAAVPAMRQALQTTASAEVRDRIERLLPEALLKPAPPKAEHLGPCRALAVLEAIHSPAARQTVARLAEGDALALLTLEAKATLARLEAAGR